MLFTNNFVLIVVALAPLVVAQPQESCDTDTCKVNKDYSLLQTSYNMDKLTKKRVQEKIDSSHHYTAKELGGEESSGHLLLDVDELNGDDTSSFATIARSIEALRTPNGYQNHGVKVFFSKNSCMTVSWCHKNIFTDKGPFSTKPAGKEHQECAKTNIVANEGCSEWMQPFMLVVAEQLKSKGFDLYLDFADDELMKIKTEGIKHKKPWMEMSKEFNAVLEQRVKEAQLFPYFKSEFTGPSCQHEVDTATHSIKAHMISLDWAEFHHLFNKRLEGKGPTDVVQEQAAGGFAGRWLVKELMESKPYKMLQKTKKT